MMENREAFDLSLIAPCGMNCGLCYAYLRDKKKCPGCNGVDVGKSASCLKCRIKNCENLPVSDFPLCYECDKFPCNKIKHIDKRYRTKYAMSMIENLKEIEALGRDKFMVNQKIKWICGNCGGTVCVHKGYCLNCKAKK